MPDYGWTFTTSTDSTSSSNLVWSSWLNSTSATVTNDIWTVWNGTTTIRSTNTYVPYTIPQRTPEQQAAYEAEQARQREEWARQEERRKADEAEAKRRAKVLLEESLTPEQLAQFRDNGWFEVVTPKGTYRIRNGWSGNVDRINAEGRATDRYCIHPREPIPTEDNMLAQKLMLETMEETFLRIANRSTPPSHA